FITGGDTGRVITYGPLVHFTLAVAAPPTLSATMPPAGQLLHGVVAIPVIGTVDPTWADAPEVIGLLVDGQRVPNDSLVQCAVTAVGTCSGTVYWDTTGDDGPHTLQVFFTTSKLEQVLGPLVTVTVFNSGPTASISLVHSGEVVSGKTVVEVAGTLDPAETATGVSVQLLVDKIPAGSPQPCPPGPKCVGDFTWDPNGADGVHLLTARFVTSTAGTRSSLVAVGVLTHPVIQLNPLVPLKPGSTATISGRVSYPPNARGLFPPGAAVLLHLTFTPAVGPASTLEVVSGRDGTFTAIDPEPVRSNTQVTMTSGLTTAQTTVQTTARVSCHVPAQVRHAKRFTVTCAIPGLPDRTTVRLYDNLSGRHQLAAVKAMGGKATIRVVFPHKLRTSVPLWVTVAASQAYAVTSSTTHRLRVL
ncbi:MAG: hypothetical protein QOE76_3526, partial [Frankiales bacterium]|nr:hypothetical protein [Frankiales bacterium]